MNAELRAYLNNLYQALVHNEGENVARTRANTRQDLLIASRNFLRSLGFNPHEVEDWVHSVKDQASTWVSNRRDWNYDEWESK